MSLLDLLNTFPVVKQEPSKRAKKRAAKKRNRKEKQQEQRPYMNLEESVPSSATLNEALGIIKKNPSYRKMFDPK